MGKRYSAVVKRTKDRKREDGPGESANRAYSIAENLLAELAQYCEAPTDPADIGDFNGCVERLREAQNALSQTGHLRTQGWLATPDPRLMEAIRSADAAVVDVHTRTFAQRAIGTESRLVELRAALGNASA